MVALAAAPPVNERKRVKVYELRENDWFDRGTGFCAVHAISDEGRIWVTSEEDGDSALLDARIKKDDNYQKQQETLIVWTDPSGIDMALSFQEAEGCGIVWDTINEAQSQLLGYVKPVPTTTFELPPPTLKELENIERVVREGTSTQQSRDVTTKALLTNNYIARLTALVEDAEDLESLEDLHRLCNVMKQIILYNDNGIIEYIIQDEIIGNAVGALEYDPDFPEHKANHRQFLSENSKFKEVVRISDPDIRRKIHHTYRLQYLKDVALARVLDDPSFSLFNSLIYFHHIDIVQHVANDAPFLQEIFEIITSKQETPQRKKDAIVFIQQSCATAKSLQVPSRTSLYSNLVNCGLTAAISFALQHKDPSVRVAGTDILVALIDHDITMMRATVSRAANDHVTPMTDTLIDLLLVETDIGIKAQVAEAIKVLLDSNPANSPGDRPFGNGDNIAAKFGNAKINHANKIFLENRLQPSMKKLFQPLMELDQRDPLTDISFHESSLFSHLVEILGFFIRQPSSQSKSFILSEGLIPRTARLLSCPEKHLRLTAIKLFRICVGAPDPGDHYIRSLIQNDIFSMLLTMLLSDSAVPNAAVPLPQSTPPRDNLLNSSILDLFEYIRANRMKLLVMHLAETLRPHLTTLAPHLLLFSQLLHDYDVIMDPSIPTPTRQIDMDSSFMTSEAGSPAPRHEINNAGSTRWQGLKDDADEEAYFSTADDEDDDDELSRDHLPHLPNGLGSPSAGHHASPLKRLVEYGDDDDDNDEDDDDDNDQVTLAASNATEGEAGPSDSVVDAPLRPQSSKSGRHVQHHNHNLRNPTQSFLDSDSSSPSPSSPESNLRHDTNVVDASPSPSSERDGPSSTSTAPSSTPPPPLSIAEKRRREEDDEDELGKLAVSTRGAKRRNSGGASAASPVSTTTAPATPPSAAAGAKTAADADEADCDSDAQGDTEVNGADVGASQHNASSDTEAEAEPGPQSQTRAQSLRRKRPFGPGIGAGAASGGKKIAISLVPKDKDKDRDRDRDKGTGREAVQEQTQGQRR